MPLPGGSYYGEFVTSNPTTGAAQNADSLPTATANRNGTDDGTFSLTVANIDIGRYKVTGTVPAGYATGDTVLISVAATVATVAGKGVIDGFTVDATVSSRSTYAGADTAGTTTLLSRLTATRAGNLDFLDVAVSSRSTYAGADTTGTTSVLAMLTGLVVSADHAQFTAHALSLAPVPAAGADPWTIALPGAYAAGTAGAILGGRLDVAVSSRSTYAGGAVASVTAPVTVGTITDKVGYNLAATGLDAIPTAAPSGPAVNFPQMMVQVWRRWFKAGNKNANTHTIATLADDGVTVLTTQSWTDDGHGNETLGSAS